MSNKIMKKIRHAVELGMKKKTKINEGKGIQREIERRKERVGEGKESGIVKKREKYNVN